MKLYYWIWNDPAATVEVNQYCGGTTVVAANSEEEAKELIREGYTPTVCRPVLDINLVYEIKGATIDCKKPKILIQEGYIE